MLARVLFKNHRSRADGLCDIPINPPLEFGPCRWALVKRAALNDLWNESPQQTPYRRLGELVPVSAYRRHKQVGSEHSSACPRQKIEVTLLQY